MVGTGVDYTADCRCGIDGPHPEGAVLGMAKTSSEDPVLGVAFAIISWEFQTSASSLDGHTVIVSKRQENTEMWNRGNVEVVYNRRESGSLEQHASDVAQRQHTAGRATRHRSNTLPLT